MHATDELRLDCTIGSRVSFGVEKKPHINQAGTGLCTFVLLGRLAKQYWQQAECAAVAVAARAQRLLPAPVALWGHE